MPTPYEDSTAPPKHVVTQSYTTMPKPYEYRDRDDNAIDEPVPNWTE